MPSADPPDEGTAGLRSSAQASAQMSLRERVRAFFDLIVPENLALYEGRLERARAWRKALYQAGFGGLGYPVEFGGHGSNAADLAVYEEESRGRLPPEEDVFAIGVRMALPIIRDLGSTDLKSRFLGPGLSGEEIWCQLYSEPGAGSDLASLSTSAVADGDEWVVNGQKVWTSGAHHSQMGIPARAHRPRSTKAPWHNNVCAPDGASRRDGTAPASDDRRCGFQRGVLRRRPDTTILGGRRRQRRVAGGCRAARIRTRRDRHVICRPRGIRSYQGRSCPDTRRSAG